MYRVNVSHTSKDLVDCRNGALKCKRDIKQENNRAEMWKVLYLEIGETDTQLPNVQLEGIIGPSRSELRCLMTSIMFRFREGAAKRETH